MSLKDNIDSFKAKALPQIPDDILALMQETSAALKASGLASRALGTSDMAVDFTLTNATGDSVSLASLLRKGPVVLNFYRGGWCPYCNMELKALRDELDEIEALGASLVAITPELPDGTLSTMEKYELQFEVLTDRDCRVAAQYGLVFSVDEALRPIYQNWGSDLFKANDDPDWKLPLPATYVVAQDGKIVHSFVEEDYTQRMEPVEIIEALKRLQTD